VKQLDESFSQLRLRGPSASSTKQQSNTAAFGSDNGTFSTGINVAEYLSAPSAMGLSDPVSRTVTA